MLLNTAAPYQPILDQCEPFVVSWTANWPHLDLEPLGLPIDRVVSATSLDSRSLVDGLHRLDAATFGDQDMLMPRWVMFDCGEFPGIVFGFGRKARHLSSRARNHYRVSDPDTFVPLSMWVAVPCAEPRAWFGHNLSSANVLLQEDRMPGLGTLTKLLGVVVTRADKQYGATQWSSKSLGIHLRMGTLKLLSAYTPAHTHPETFSYQLTVDHDHLRRLATGDTTQQRPAATEWLASDDAEAMLSLQERLEKGDQIALVNLDRETGQIGLAALAP